MKEGHFRDKSYCFLFFILLQLHTAVALNSPIILVNGLGGAVMEGKLNHVPKEDTHAYCSANTKDWFTLWLSIEEVSPIVKNCLEDHLIPIYDQTNQCFSDPEGVEIRMKDFGGVSGLAYLDPSVKISADSYFEPLIEYLTGMSSTKGGNFNTMDDPYIIGKNLFGAPFDWRYCPSELERRSFYSNLTSLIESIFTMNDNTPVTLITHSMGGPIILDYLQKSNEKKYEIDDDWKSKYLHAYVPLSSPFGGAVSSLEGMISGDNFGLPLPADYFRNIQANCPSGLYLLPRLKPGLWTPDEVLVSTPSKNYTAGNLKSLYEDLGLTLAVESFDFVTKQTLDDEALEPPSSKVSVYPIYGTNVQTTIGALEYESDFNPNKIPKVSKIAYEPDGDGTVNIRSLERFTSWKNDKDYDYESLVHPTVILHQSHIGVIGDSITFQVINSITTL